MNNLYLSVSTLLVLSVVSGAVVANDAYYNDRERGWFWYEVIPDPNEVRELENVPQPVIIQTGALPGTLSPREQLKQQGEDWEDTLALAILEPSKKNYLEYLRQTRQITEQSSQFATGFKQTIWSNPEFDSSLVNPVNPNAIRAKNETDNRLANIDLQEIANTKGLLFFFRSDCPFCHRFAPIFKRFGETHGIEIVPISLDGPGLPDYPNPELNVALGEQLGVSHVPAVYMVDPVTDAVAPVSFGFTDATSLQEKILYAGQQIKTEYGQ